MRKLIMFIVLMSSSLLTLAQSAADFNYSIGVRAYSIMQLPKILNQINSRDYTNTYGNGILVKFNDNQISYRIGGTYFSDNVSFTNTCATCEIASGKVTDYSFKIGFEKTFTYSRVQPYFAFDLGYRFNRFNGDLKPAGESFNSKNANVTKNGLVLAPVIGVKVNIIPQLTLFAESNMDFYFLYEKQDIMAPDGDSRTVNKYNRLECLLNPISAGLHFNISRRN